MVRKELGYTLILIIVLGGMMLIPGCTDKKENCCQETATKTSIITYVESSIGYSYFVDQDGYEYSWNSASSLTAPGYEHSILRGLEGYSGHNVTFEYSPCITVHSPLGPHYTRIDRIIADHSTCSPTPVPAQCCCNCQNQVDVKSEVKKE